MLGLFNNTLLAFGSIVITLFLKILWPVYKFLERSYIKHKL